MAVTRLARYKKAVAGVVGTLAALAVGIPLDADPRLIAAGGLVSSLAVLLGPANATPPRHGPAMTRLAQPSERGLDSMGVPPPTGGSAQHGAPVDYDG